MRYLENAFRFTFKNFVIALPLLISMVIPAVIMNIGTIGFTVKLAEKYQRLFENMSIGQTPEIGIDFYSGLFNKPMIISMIVALALSLLFSILVYPATYGLINKKYETGKATLSDFTQCMSKYIGRYVLFMLLNFAIVMGLYLVFVILVVIAAVILTQVSTVVGVLLVVLFSLAFIVGYIALIIYMSLWFPAVCIEDTGIIQGLKNSFKYVKGSFWPILGITLLVSLCGAVGAGILGLFPIIGTVISSVITTLAGYIIIVYYFELYRAKTGRFETPENTEQLEGGVQ